MARKAAQRIVLAAERYNGPEPLNRSVGQTVTIRELVTLIAEPTGFSGKVRRVPTKQEGQRRHFPDKLKATDRLGFNAPNRGPACRASV
jgi:GDP-L-fucose synthase